VSEELRQLLASAGAELHESPATLDAFYDAAAISVAPLQAGGGTSIKVLESLAHAVPTVATPTAVRGLDLSAGIHLAVADSAAEFAAACIDLLRAPERALALGRGGREEVFRRFSWDAAGANARAALRQLLGDRATGD
jgi:glycosyltransferase involved in cell wall biosynthesis